MSYCTLCGKKSDDIEVGHKSCVKKLFNADYWPKINLGLSDVALRAQEMAGKLSISGVQAKLSLKLNRRIKELEVTGKGGEYILKPQIETFPHIPQNENLCMNIAGNLGIMVPAHSLIQLKDRSWAYIVRRFDRVKKDKLHQEDFCQILGRQDKYQGSCEEIGKKLKEISDVPGLDVQLFFERILFFFIIGNGDAHLKNFSIIYDEAGHVRISPAYDIVSSKLVIPKEEDFALTINGKRNKITGKDFNQLAQTLKTRPKASYQKILGKITLVNEFIKNSLLTSEEKERLTQVVKERVSRVESDL